MLKTQFWFPAAILAINGFAADLPVREVVIFKNGVAYFERAGELKPGETARLDFKAEDMNDVLKSLTITDRSGAKINSVRYDASESVEKRLENFPFTVGPETSLAKFLDQMKGATLNLTLGNQNVAGAIVSARLIKADKDTPEREVIVLLMDSGEIRSFDLGAASAVKFADPKLDTQLKDYLAVLSQARSKDRRSIYIDATSSAAGEMIARYTTPSPVWKSSYRLIFSSDAQPTLEGWAIVDNTTGDDWNNVHLSVVSGKPVSFITRLYEPRYVDRPEAELAENRPVAPVVSEGVIGGVAMAPAPPMARIAKKSAMLSAAETVELSPESSLAATAEGREEGELFSYSFASPVTVKKGESAMLPFLQQKITARKLLIYSENFGLHARNAAELTNSTGKTLDGGPITVYDAGSYAGEALAETIKAGDKRLVSYGVDLGTRITTAFDSLRDLVREIHLSRGMLTTRSAIQETRTYSIRNVDAQPKTLIIEHAERPGYRLLDQKPFETTANAYRFEVKLAPSATQTFAVREERVYDQTFAVSNASPDQLVTWTQNKSLSDAARRQLAAMAQKKRDIAANDAAAAQTGAELKDLTQDETRLRENIASLSKVSGQQEQVQSYARELAGAETKIAALRDRQSQLRRARSAMQTELDTLIENADF
ncbi:MAG TPA: DUF4139 domain-containing protein [Bryobacteraceae bacterium]|nr:DUF4139 domain-containing protein [Bryobacteraceae bacterium]